MNLPSRDTDIEVFGLSVAELVTILTQFGTPKLVGASFGVIKLTTHDGQEFDFSLPRRDSKQGQGHKGFVVEFDSEMTIKEAAQRCDFTFNSMSMDINGRVIDPFDGQGDIEVGLIRHTSMAFVDDPLRPLRGFRFGGQLDFEMHHLTVGLCHDMLDEFDTLAPERIRDEFFKWAERSIKPSSGLHILKEMAWVTKFPQLNALIGLQQDLEWHPEGDVWSHTLHTCDVANKICDRKGIEDERRVILVLAALCHDFGKATTTETRNGHIISHGHDKAGEEPTRAFLGAMKAPKRIIEAVIELVCEHMVHVHCMPNKRTVRRLISRLEHITVEDLLILIEADHGGRSPLPGGLPENARVIGVVAEELGNEIKPILMGRHLLDLLEPGPEMGRILHQVFEAQLDGLFNDVDGALEWGRKEQLWN